MSITQARFFWLAAVVVSSIASTNLCRAPLQMHEKPRVVDVKSSVDFFYFLVRQTLIRLFTRPYEKAYKRLHHFCTRGQRCDGNT
jgi:hypothetical protein